MLLALLLAASPATPLNSEGFRLYQAGQYDAALEQFRKAVEADPRHALSQYNLAATLALLRGQGKVCEYDAYPGTILQHLALAVRLDPRRKKRMVEDTDFDSIRASLGYQRLLGRSPKNVKDVPALLTAVRWYTPAPGAYGNTHHLQLKADGTLVLGKLALEGEDLRRVETAGTWSARGARVSLRFEQPVEGHQALTGVLQPDGHLVFPAANWDFTDEKSECDA